MKHQMELNTEFANALGNLFYAMAAADRKVHVKERVKLSQVLRSKWANEPHQINLEQIVHVLDKLNESQASADNSFELFVAYREKHPEQFDHKTQVLIWSTVCAISIACAQNNKSELIFLSKL